MRVPGEGQYIYYLKDYSLVAEMYIKQQMYNKYNECMQ